MSNPNDPAAPGSGQPDPTLPPSYPHVYEPPQPPAAPPGFGQAPPPQGFEPPAPPPGFGQPPTPFAPQYYGSGDPAWGGVDPRAEDPLISRDFAGWCRKGTALAKAAWRPLLLLQLIEFVALAVVTAPFLIFGGTVLARVLTAVRDAAPGEDPNLDFLAAEMPIFILLAGVAALIAAVVSALVQLASFRVVIAAAGAGERLTAGGALRSALPRVLPFIGWFLLAVPIYLLGFVACILPVFYVAAALYMVPVIVAVERSNPIGRSFSLFHKSPGAALGRIVSIVALGMVVSAITNTVSQFALSGLISTDPSQHVDFADAIGPILAGIAGVTVLSTVLRMALALLTIPLTVLTYTDLRGRAEPGTTTATIRAELQLATA